MLKAAVVALAALVAAPSARAEAVGAPADLAGRLVGKTLSAVTYLPRPHGMPGHSELIRLMLQAYLRADGRAVVRLWDEARDSYTRPAVRRWTLSGSTLCLDLPSIAPGMMCTDVHVWGPRIAGIGIHPYAMLDGDLQPGDAIATTR